jgi:hypothetical protein
MAQFPNYNIIPVQEIIYEVTNLLNLNIGILHNILEKDGIQYFVSLIRYKQNYSEYLGFISRKITPDNPESLIYFISVQYDSQGVLVANTFDINSISVPLTNIRSRIDINFRSKFYRLNFDIPQLDRYRETKEAISNLFVFPNLTYVISGELVVSFVNINQEFFTISYLGHLNPEKNLSEPLFTWDYADGTLIGKFDNQITYYWNKQEFKMVNQFPEITFEESSITKSLLGGYIDYVISDQTPFILVKNDIIVRATKASRFNYNANSIIGDKVDFTPLAKFVEIDCNTYLIGFSNINGNSVFQSYALLLNSNPINANYPFTTFSIPVQFVGQTNSEYLGLKYTFDKQNQLLLINNNNFEDFLNKNKGHIILSDINPYYLWNDGTVFDPITNNIDFSDRQIGPRQQMIQRCGYYDQQLEQRQGTEQQMIQRQAQQMIQRQGTAQQMIQRQGKGQQMIQRQGKGQQMIQRQGKGLAAVV